MSKQEFQVGDLVEVLPAPEGAAWSWGVLEGKRGEVIELDFRQTILPLTMRVLFSRRDSWWCDPAWLRRVPHPHEETGQSDPGGRLSRFKVGDRVRYKDASEVRYVASVCLKYRLGGGEAWVDEGNLTPVPTLSTEPPAPLGTPSTSFPRYCIRCGKPEHSSTACKAMLTDFCGMRAVIVPAVWVQRFRIGDLVDMGEFRGGVVLSVDAEPRYSVQWSDGHVQRIRESTLRPHVPAPARCTPAGTLCRMMDDFLYRLTEQTGQALAFDFLFPDGCPWCAKGG